MKHLPILVLLAAAGCGPIAKSSRHLKPDVQAPPEQWQGVARIAVLPPDNWTHDLGLEYITWYRALVHDLLRAKGYAVTPLVDVNHFLLKNKFTMAGEATMYPPDELGKHLGADAILYWDITQPGNTVRDGPCLNFNLIKADGTALWCTGEARLSLAYNAPTQGGFDNQDRELALAISEVLRRIPAR